MGVSRNLTCSSFIAPPYMSRPRLNAPEDLFEEEILEIQVGCIRRHLIQYPIGIPPPHPHESLASEELLDHLTQGEIENVSEVSVNYDVTIEPFDQNPLIGRDGRARSSVSLYLLDDPSHSVRVRGPYS